MPKLLDGRLRLPVIGSPMFIVSTPPLVLATVAYATVGATLILSGRQLKPTGHPYPRAPTLRMSCANIGRSAVADEKNVAKKSSSIVDRMSGEPNTNRKPSMAARHDTSCSGSCASRTARL